MTTTSTLLHAIVLATCFAVYVKGTQPPEMTGLRRALQTIEATTLPRPHDGAATALAAS